MSNEPEYTKGKRSIVVGEPLNVRAEDPKDEYVPWWMADYAPICGSHPDEPKGNARLSKASDNAVIELADHLGVNAVLLAERLEGGVLVRLVEALKEARSGLCAYTGGPDGACGDTIGRMDSALSHLTASP